jgi:hypothetical protein
MLLCYVDYKAYSGKVTDTLYGLKKSLSHDSAYIAALTAFVVVNTFAKCISVGYRNYWRYIHW